MIVDPVRIWLIIPKMVVAIMFLFFAIKIHKQSDYFLNKVFFFAFISWGIYNTFDSVSFTFAPVSYTSFIICSILWSLQIILLNLYTGLIFSASTIITKGESKARNNKFLVIEISILLIATILMIIFAPLQIVDGNKILIDPKTLPPLPTVEFSTAEGFSIISGIASAIPFIFYIVATINLISVIRKTEHGDLRNKMIGLVIGINLIPVGLLYFLIRGLFFQTYTVWNSMIGQFLFLISPILIFWALNRKPNHPEEIEKSRKLEQFEHVKQE